MGVLAIALFGALYLVVTPEIASVALLLFFLCWIVWFFAGRYFLLWLTSAKKIGQKEELYQLAKRLEELSDVEFQSVYLSYKTPTDIYTIPVGRRRCVLVIGSQMIAELNYVSLQVAIAESFLRFHKGRLFMKQMLLFPYLFVKIPLVTFFQMLPALLQHWCFLFLSFVVVPIYYFERLVLMEERRLPELDQVMLSQGFQKEDLIYLLDWCQKQKSLSPWLDAVLAPFGLYQESCSQDLYHLLSFSSQYSVRRGQLFEQ